MQSKFGDDGELTLELYENPETSGTARAEQLKKLLTHKASDFRIIVRQKYLSHGLYGGKDDGPASLLVLVFELKSTATNQKRRFRQLQATLRFESDKDGDVGKEPYVKSFAPAMLGDVYLLPTQVITSDSKDNKANVGFEKYLKFAVEHRRKQDEQFSRTWLTKVQAFSDESEERDGRPGDDSITWVFNENEKQTFMNMPDTFAVAVLLRRTEKTLKVYFDFKAKVDVWYDASITLQTIKHSWHKIKDKITQFDGIREATVTFVENKQGSAPPQADLRNLSKLAEGERHCDLDNLAFIHLAELVSPIQFYNDGVTGYTGPHMPDNVPAIEGDINVEGDVEVDGGED